jgi:adenylyltransferase/sulfurtransferase
MDSQYEISPKELADQLQNGNKPRLLDVREPQELNISQLPGAELIPLGQLPARLADLDTADNFVVFCRTGVRSGRAVEFMRSAGFKKVKNLKGGINAWARTVDPSLPIY